MAGLLSKDITLGYDSTGAGSSYTDLPLLMEVPEIGGEAEKVDVTVLSDPVKKYIDGIKDYGDLAFKFLYDNSGATSSYRILKGLEGAASPTKFQVSIPDGTKLSFSGFVSVKLDSAAVNAALTFTATIALNSDIEVTNPSDE